MYMGKGGVKAAVLTCSFDLSLGCHAGRDEKGETCLKGTAGAGRGAAACRMEMVVQGDL
jgi:hypothetical protein